MTKQERKNRLKTKRVHVNDYMHGFINKVNSKGACKNNTSDKVLYVMTNARDRNKE
jgi:hypothetical protein